MGNLSALRSRSRSMSRSQSLFSSKVIVMRFSVAQLYYLLMAVFRDRVSRCRGFHSRLCVLEIPWHCSNTRLFRSFSDDCGCLRNEDLGLGLQILVTLETISSYRKSIIITNNSLACSLSAEEHS